MGMVGPTLTHMLPANNLDTLQKVIIYILFSILSKLLLTPLTDTSYTKNERMRYNQGQSLPTFMTFVGCYGDEQKLIDCAYHEFESRSTLMTSNDVSISCGFVASSRVQSESSEATTSNDVSLGRGAVTSSAQSASSEAVASLSISIIVALALIALVAVLIILLIMQRRKRTTKRYFATCVD